MANYILSTTSTSDLSEKHYLDRNIKYLCFHFSMDGKDYTDDLGKSIPFHEFYQKMQEGALTKTSQISVGEYVDIDFAHFIT